MLNSDWSDSFFHDYSPNVFAGSAESHLNSAMVLAIFPKLIGVLEASKHQDVNELVAALKTYQGEVGRAFFNIVRRITVTGRLPVESCLF